MKKYNLRRWLRFCYSSLILGLFILIFSGAEPFLTSFLHSQLAPSLLSLLQAFSLGIFLVVVGIMILTLLFGRIYCSFLCPLGLGQELLVLLLQRKVGTIPNLPRLRLLIFGLTCGPLLFGWNIGFLFFDPYSNFGRMIGRFTLFGFISFLLLVILVWWKKRLFCTSICPIGTLLGWLSKKSLYRLTLSSDRCVKCGQCSTICPTDCIDLKNGIIDNERCLRCFSCFDICPQSGINFSRKKPPLSRPKEDPSRREFLIQGGFLLTGTIASLALTKTGLSQLLLKTPQNLILPPGADNLARFTSKCTTCQLCVNHCPNQIIVPPKNGVGPVFLDFNRGSCKIDCQLCSQVCPTGAIKSLTLEKKLKTKIAQAKFYPQNCQVLKEGLFCSKCALVCPTKAIKLQRNGAPRRINSSRCIGCGACQTICPAEEKAIRILAIEKQIEIN